ncbi:hypothetical protein DPMN_104536 [Dreissena polymorpha]|uniref:Uncharacterized protein n=1 Tax=Dreissena polymorpha TaxID=45954 RepID=A0A9D4K1R5_DREPO|nr:hypothetical protein DPMN_104536 [Dreissena polymorpha]
MEHYNHSDDRAKCGRGSSARFGDFKNIACARCNTDIEIEVSSLVCPEIPHTATKSPIDSLLVVLACMSRNPTYRYQIAYRQSPGGPRLYVQKSHIPLPNRLSTVSWWSSLVCPEIPHTATKSPIDSLLVVLACMSRNPIYRYQIAYRQSPGGPRLYVQKSHIPLPNRLSTVSWWSSLVCPEIPHTATKSPIDSLLVVLACMSRNPTYRYQIAYRQSPGGPRLYVQKSHIPLPNRLSTVSWWSSLVCPEIPYTATKSPIDSLLVVLACMSRNPTYRYQIAYRQSPGGPRLYVQKSHIPLPNRLSTVSWWSSLVCPEIPHTATKSPIDSLLVVLACMSRNPTYRYQIAYRQSPGGPRLYVQKSHIPLPNRLSTVSWWSSIFKTFASHKKKKTRMRCFAYELKK